MKLAAPILFSLAAVLLPGCADNMWWEYRDDPYIAKIAEKGRPEVMRAVNSTNKENRMIALRILAEQAGDLRRDGRRDEAAELEEIIIQRYFIEKEQEVRACIVRICAPAVGRGSSAMVRFLRDRIAAGEFPGYAALALASMGPRNAVADIVPLTRHPAPEIRYQAATALVLLGDPDGYDAVVRVWKGMLSSVWPDTVEGMTLEEAKAGLESRARRSFGKPLR